MTDENIEVQCSNCGARFVTSVFTGADMEAGEDAGVACCPVCGAVRDRPMRTDDGVLIRNPGDVS